MDDNVDNRAIYCTILEHRGHVCHEAADGEEGVLLAHELSPDLILLDISMPVMDGWRALEVLRSSPATRAIPVVALTAHALVHDEIRAQEAGFDGYIRKPIEPMRVVEVVEHLLVRSSQSHPAA